MSLKTRAIWEKGKGQVGLTCWSPGSISRKREKENGGEAGRGDTGDFENGWTSRNAECGVRKTQKSPKKPRIQSQP